MMGHTGLILTTAPASEPVTLTEAKAYLRVDTSDEDTLISALIASARQFVEEYTKRALITQTYNLWLDQPCSNEPWWDGVREGALASMNSMPSKIILPKPPFQDLLSVTTYDLNDASTAFDITNFIQDKASIPGRLVLKYNKTWPANLRYSQSVDIQYKAGYGLTGSSVPSALLMAIKMMIAHYYEHRTPFELGGANEVPLSVQALLNPYVVLSL